MTSIAPPLDRRLLEGFRFACRPGCGLCCYASPAVSAPEADRLLRIEPELPLRPDGQEGFRLLASRPDGGACTLLQDARCRHHDLRPYPCRSFPIVTHLGRRAQSALVLSCPGLDLAPLVGEGRPSAGRSPSGLEGEIAAAEAEAARASLFTLLEEATRAEEELLRRRARRGSPDPEGARAALRKRLPDPDPTGTFALPPPGEDAAIEELPLFFDPAFGRVALRSTEVKTYEALEIAERGGVVRRIGEIPLPERPPELTSGAARLFDGYRRYVLDRDHFLWSAYFELSSGREGSVPDVLTENLVEISTELLYRSAVLARLHGEPGERLDAPALEAGIRSLDAEVLDRPTLGRVL
jgi:Fe-S-cluster containining protein